MKGIVDQAPLNQLFHDARSYNGWHDTPVSTAQLHGLYAILKMGPTAFNCCPGRFVFLQTPAAKERIKPHLMPNNVIKTMTAPVLVIIAHDTRFFDHFDKLTPFRPENKDHFVDDEARAALLAEHGEAMPLSVKRPGDVTALRERILGFFLGEEEDAEFLVPWPRHGEIAHLLHEKCRVLAEKSEAEGARFSVRAPASVLDDLRSRLAGKAT